MKNRAQTAFTVKVMPFEICWFSSFYFERKCSRWCHTYSCFITTHWLTGECLQTNSMQTVDDRSNLLATKAIATRFLRQYPVLQTILHNDSQQPLSNQSGNTHFIRGVLTGLWPYKANIYSLSMLSLTIVTILAC